MSGEMRWREVVGWSSGSLDIWSRPSYAEMNMGSVPVPSPFILTTVKLNRAHDAPFHRTVGFNPACDVPRHPSWMIQPIL